MHKRIRMALLTLALLAGTASAQSCPGVAPWVFVDVAASHAFCTYVTWMAQNNVSLGCRIIDANNREYCPDDYVTRLQMAGFMNRLGNALFPLTCAAGQVMKWNGAAWTCADDSLGGSGGGGTVTSVLAGTGLSASPNPITGAGSINLAASYRLPQACAANQVPKWIAGAWACANDADTNSGGTVTSLTQGSGIVLAPNPVVGAGTISADTAYLQRRVSVGCAAGSSIRAIAADGSVTCEVDDAGPANAFVQGGNAFGTTAILGTTDSNALDVRVNGSRVMRYEPNVTSPNVVGGHPNNGVDGRWWGQTVAGGGLGGTCLGWGISRPCMNVAMGVAATVGGGWGNTANGWSSTVGGGFLNTAIDASTVGGGEGNAASGYASTVGGGAGNTASGEYSTIGGGLTNIASGNHSLAGGRRAKTQTADTIPVVHHGAFVWADGSDFDFNTGAANEFAVRATGGVRFVTAINGAGAPTRTVAIDGNGELEFGNVTRQMINLWSGADSHGIGIQNWTQYFRIDSPPATGGGFAWYRGGTHSNTTFDPGTGGVTLMTLDRSGNLTTTGTVNGVSDVARKTAFRPADPGAILERVVGLPITTWRYRADAAEVRHIGPTAQDFAAAFAVGVDDKHIAMVDADGVALAAIQGLNAKVVEQAREIAELREQFSDVRALQAELVALKNALAELRRERAALARR